MAVKTEVLFCDIATHNSGTELTKMSLKYFGLVRMYSDCGFLAI